MKNKNTREKQIQVEEELIKNSKLSIEQLFTKFKTTSEGISLVDVEERIDEYGKNTIELTLF